MALSRAQQSPLIQSSHLRKFTTYIFIKIHAFLPDRNEWKFGKSPTLNVTESEKKILDTYQKWTGSIPDQDLSIIRVFMEICSVIFLQSCSQTNKLEWLSVEDIPPPRPNISPFVLAHRYDPPKCYISPWKMLHNVG